MKRAGCGGAIGGNCDAGAPVRVTWPAGAAHVYDTFVSSMWRNDVVLTHLSPVDTKTINDLNLLFVTPVLANVSFTEGNVKILRAPMRLDSPVLYKKINTSPLVRTLINVAAGDESVKCATGRSGGSTMRDRCHACKVCYCRLQYRRRPRSSRL
jgi:hypothetical protein